MSDAKRFEGLTGALQRAPMVRLSVVTVLTGIGAGLGGMSLALFLHLLQHLAYGYSLHALVGSESFLGGVSGATPERRVIVLTICGAIAGFGWWGVYRWGQPLVSVKKAVAADGARMPVLSTLAHALLQIITVALGSPLGREVAPREVGALVAGWLGHFAKLDAQERRLLVACGAGAGLAAVYNVPLGGAVFVLEVLLGTFSIPAAVVALATSGIASVVAWIGLGDDHQYVVPHLALSANLVVWAIVCGPVFGIAAWMYTRATTQARASAPRTGWSLPLATILNFAVIGFFAILFPQILGNGRGPTQLAFDSSVTLGLAAILLVLKIAFTVSTLRAGAEGGLLTPGLTIGALMAILLGGAWSAMWPGEASGAFAVVGAAAFLAASMSMPVTAIVLIAEFTRIGHDLLIPVVFAVVGSVAAKALCEAYVARRTAVNASDVSPMAAVRDRVGK